MNTLEFSNYVLACSSFSIHAFSTNFGWVLDFLDNRSFLSFKHFRIRESMGSAFGEKTHKHSEIEATTAGSSLFKRLKYPPVLMKDPQPPPLVALMQDLTNARLPKHGYLFY
jgi:hypothetical protein